MTTINPQDIENAYGSYTDGSNDEAYLRMELEEKYNLPETALDDLLNLHKENTRRYDRYAALQKAFEMEFGHHWNP